MDNALDVAISEEIIWRTVFKVSQYRPTWFGVMPPAPEALPVNAEGGVSFI
jgi:hypothetical protein